MLSTSELCINPWPHIEVNFFFIGSFYLFNGILTFVGYLIPNLSLYKDSSGTIQPIAGGGGIEMSYFS